MCVCVCVFGNEEKWKGREAKVHLFILVLNLINFDVDCNYVGT